MIVWKSFNSLYNFIHFIYFGCQNCLFADSMASYLQHGIVCHKYPFAAWLVNLSITIYILCLYSVYSVIRSLSNLATTFFFYQARFWVQVIDELRHGVRLKKRNYERTPIEYELTPYEILMGDIRAKWVSLQTTENNRTQFEGTEKFLFLLFSSLFLNHKTESINCAR